MSNFNADLVDDLARQRVVLFLGSGVSSSALTRSGTTMKGWHAFLESACSFIQESDTNDIVKECLQKEDYLLASEILQVTLAEKWEQLIREEYGQAAEPSSLHEAIIGLDQRIIITTNFDKMIETCWHTRIGQSKHFPLIKSNTDDDTFSILKDHTNKYLVKIHGTVDNVSAIVFSRSQYIKSAFGSITYGSFIESLLLNYTIVFIGFSMRDPAICSMLERYALHYPKARPHYMFAPEGAPSVILDVNKRLRKLHVIPYNTEEQHRNLPTIIRTLADMAREQRRTIIADALVELRDP